MVTALTIALAITGRFPWDLVFGYIIAQMLGGILGATLAYLTYKAQMDAEPEPAVKLGVFSTGPSIDAPIWNVVTEIIGTFILVLGILAFGYGEVGIQVGNGAFFVGLLVVIIGMATGGATGYAINPARDLGPRIAHAILPIKGKGGSNWKYSWIPVVGPIIGGILGLTIGKKFNEDIKANNEVKPEDLIREGVVTSVSNDKIVTPESLSATSRKCSIII